MSNKTKAIIAIVVAIGGLAGGGTFLSLDLSTNTNTNISDDDTSVSNTNIFNTIKDELIEDATMAAICNSDEIPDTHVEACKVWRGP